MSEFYTSLFKAGPEAFVNTYTVDIKSWFENLKRGKIKGMARTWGLTLCDAANDKGVCRVDLTPVGGVLGYGVNTVQFELVPYGGIEAYWAPYHAGTGLPGFTEVLRKNPPCKFVFTAGMNGCAFVVTDSPKGVAYMRVYHNQHPDSDSVMQDIHNVGQSIISYADFSDYGGGQLKHLHNPLAFNFLYYRNGEWNYVFQPQSFYALSQAPAQRLIGKSHMRSVF